MENKLRAQLDFFRNRLARNEKVLRRWARRESVYAYRLYDRDIPEIPLALDWYRSPAQARAKSRKAEPHAGTPSASTSTIGPMKRTSRKRRPGLTPWRPRPPASLGSSRARSSAG
jgi:23S rRNA G2069 N7-methylase RlmK/C1962 C5-methylase RlmI